MSTGAPPMAATLAARHFCSHPWPHHMKVQWNRHRGPCQSPNSIHVTVVALALMFIGPWMHNTTQILSLTSNDNSSPTVTYLYTFNTKLIKSKTGNYRTKPLIDRTMNAVAPYNHHRENITITMKEHGIYTWIIKLNNYKRTCTFA